jgi:Ca2+-binding RTX toxin-like protein
MGDSGADRLYGGTGESVIMPGPGDDLVSGTGVTYHGEGAGVTVDLAAGTATGDTIGTDTLVKVNFVTGTDHADTIYGDEATNYLAGGYGDDYIDGRGGNDRIDGRSGETATDGTASDNDTVIGGAGNDVISDDGRNDAPYDSADTMMGGAGDDILYVGRGANSIDGGDGTDWLRQGDNTSLALWQVDLTAHTAISMGATSSVTAIENIYSGQGDDTLRGDDGPNHIIGSHGADQLYGEGGNDTLQAGPEGVAPDAGDQADGGDGTDTCVAVTTVNCEA